MNRNKWIVIFILIAVFTIGIITSAYPDFPLLSKFPWLLMISAGIGIILGALTRIFKGKTVIENGKVSRHGIGAFIQHWLTALGIFLLIISGFIIGFLFFPNIADTPKSVLFPLNMHFIGLNISLLGGFYFLTSFLYPEGISVLIPNIKEYYRGLSENTC
jgi:cytochrome b561